MSRYRDTTIVITTHDRPRMFPLAYESARDTGARVFVVDDGSMPSYARADLRIEKSVGYAQARRWALDWIQTPYMAFLDDDDVLLEEWLDRSLALIEKADVVASSFFETDERLEHWQPVHLIPPTIEDFEAGTCPVNDGALCRTSVLQSVTWHPERDTAMMFGIWHDLVVKRARFAVVPEPSWLHRLHPGNMSAHLTLMDAQWRAEALA